MTHTYWTSGSAGASQHASVDLAAALRGASAQLPDGVEEADEPLFLKVERAKQEWEATADSLSELICLLDVEGCVVRANRVLEAWDLGRVQTIKGVLLHKLLHPLCVSKTCPLRHVLEHAQPAVAQGHLVETELYDAILKRYLRVKVQSLSREVRAGLYTTVVVIEDITQRKQADEALRRYTERLEVMNELGQAILAAHSPEAIGRAALIRIRRLIPFDQARVILSDQATDGFLILTADANGETHLRPADSLPREVFLRSVGRQLEQLDVVQDLRQIADPSPVERTLIEEGLRSYVSVPLSAERQFVGSLTLGAREPGAFDEEQIRIAREVADLLAIAARQAQLYRKLQHANAELTEALKAKDEMIQNVSHELRTPLFLIKGYVEMMGEGMMGPLNNEQQEAVGVMQSQGERLGYMLDRLLAVKTIEIDTMTKVPLDVQAFLSIIVAGWQTVAAKQGVHLKLETIAGARPVAADSNLLSQVMHNLLDNAVKFSPGGGNITVTMSVTDNEQIIAVTDQGIGIPADKLERIFERFYQVSQGLHRSFGGMGIGLALCRDIIQAHNGRIWAESMGEGHGTTVYVALPSDGHGDSHVEPFWH